MNRYLFLGILFLIGFALGRLHRRRSTLLQLPPKHIKPAPGVIFGKETHLWRPKSSSDHVPPDLK